MKRIYVNVRLHGSIEDDTNVSMWSGNDRIIENYTSLTLRLELQNYENNFETYHTWQNNLVDKIIKQSNAKTDQNTSNDRSIVDQGAVIRDNQFTFKIKGHIFEQKNNYTISITGVSSTHAKCALTDIMGKDINTDKYINGGLYVCINCDLCVSSKIVTNSRAIPRCQSQTDEELTISNIRDLKHDRISTRKSTFKKQTFTPSGLDLLIDTEKHHKFDATIKFKDLKTLQKLPYDTQ